MPEELNLNEEEVIVDPEVKEPEVIQPETRFPEITKEEANPPVKTDEEEEKLDPAAEKRIAKMIADTESRLRQELGSTTTTTQELKDTLDVDTFVRDNPEYGKYRGSMLAYIKHPAYKNIPVSSIAAIVSAKDQQLLGARKEREAQQGVARTKSVGTTVRPIESGPKDWLNAEVDDFEAKKREVLRNGRLMPDIKPLEEMTLNELKDELSGMGYKAIADTLQTKIQVLGVIAGLKAKPANPETVEIPANDDDSPSQERKYDKAWKTKRELMAERLAAQPKVQVFLPLEGKDQVGEVKETIVNGQRRFKISGAVETVTINGHVEYVPKGRPWPVPQQVAEMIGQAQVETSQAGKSFELDRPDTDHPETPYARVSEALE